MKYTVTLHFDDDMVLLHQIMWIQADLDPHSNTAADKDNFLYNKSPLKNLAVLSIYSRLATCWCRSGLRFHYVNYLDKVGSGSAQQCCCFCYFHSHIILFTLKNLAILSLYYRLATWGTRIGPPACPGRDGPVTFRRPITRTSANSSPPRATHTTSFRQAKSAT